MLAELAGRRTLKGLIFPVPEPLWRKGVGRHVQCGICGGADPSGDGHLGERDRGRDAAWEDPRHGPDRQDARGGRNDPPKIYGTEAIPGNQGS